MLVLGFTLESNSNDSKWTEMKWHLSWKCHTQTHQLLESPTNKGRPFSMLWQSQILRAKITFLSLSCSYPHISSSQTIFVHHRWDNHLRACYICWLWYNQTLELEWVLGLGITGLLIPSVTIYRYWYRMKIMVISIVICYLQTFSHWILSGDIWGTLFCTSYL